MIYHFHNFMSRHFYNLVILFILSSLCDLATLKAQEKVSLPKSSYFRVMKLKGKAMSRAPFALTWREVKEGMALSYGTSLRIEKDTKLDLTFFFSNYGDLKSVQTYLFFRHDASFILNNKMMRKISLKKYFFSSIRHKDQGDPKQVGEEIDFKKAWNRVAVFISPKDASNYAPNLKADSSSNVDVGLRSKKITILYPEDGLTKYTRQFPTTLQLIWANPTQTKKSYKIYFWKFNTDFKTPLAETTNDNYSITINEPGSYFYQVRSEHDRFASKPNLVHFFPELPEFVNETAMVNRELTLLFPLPRLVRLTTQPQEEVIFYGLLPLQSKIMSPTVKISPQDPEQVMSVPVKIQQEFSVTKILPVGTYEWWLEYQTYRDEVDSHGKPQKKLVTQISEKRKFELIQIGSDRQSYFTRVGQLLYDSVIEGKAQKIDISQAQ